MELTKTTTSTGILRSPHPAEDVSQDTSGLPLDGGEGVSANTRDTTTKATHQYPPRRTKMNETDARFYLPATSTSSSNSLSILYFTLYSIMTSCALSKGHSLLHVFACFAIVCLLRISVLSSRILYPSPMPLFIVAPRRPARLPAQRHRTSL